MFLKMFPRKCFHKNDAGSLKLTASFSVGGFKGYSEVYSNLF